MFLVYNTIVKKPKKKKAKPSDADYVDNQQLYNALVEYRSKCEDAENAGRKNQNYQTILVNVF